VGGHGPLENDESIAQLVLLKIEAYRLPGLLIGGRMAGLKERLTERRAKKRAVRDERRKRSATDPRMGVVQHRKGWETEVFERGPGTGREHRPPDYGP
jgi:hypothetical protein